MIILKYVMTSLAMVALFSFYQLYFLSPSQSPLALFVRHVTNLSGTFRALPQGWLRWLPWFPFFCFLIQSSFAKEKVGV